jgi:hypothetical protein
VNERITVTLALSVTVDAQAWYAEYRADPGIDIPDRMLTHLRMLPGLRQAGGKAELRRLTRRGSRHCRQTAQHRGVDTIAYSDHAWTRMAGASVQRLKRARQELSIATQALRFRNGGIPGGPSGNFL